MDNYYDFVKAHPEEFRQFSCKEILFLIIDCPPDFTKGEDWSQHNCFLHVLSGEKRLFSREQSWFVEEGATVFMKKGAFGLEKMGNHPFCVLLFYVPDTYIRTFMRENFALMQRVDNPDLSKDQVLPIQKTEVMSAFYDSVLPYFTAGAQPPENLLELKFKELLLNIITTGINHELTAYFYKLAQPGMDDLQDIMENNCLYDLQIHEYARLCHRSLSTFKRDFQSVYGIPPGRWLLEKRLNVARQLLLNTDKPVLDVVFESGFKHIAHFDRVFKKHFGSSPLRYRKQVAGITA